MLKIFLITIICVATVSCIEFEVTARSYALATDNRYSESGKSTGRLPTSGEDPYQEDIDRLIALRTHPLDELLALANQLETKWRGDWPKYANIIMYVCSEILNRGINDSKVREASNHFAYLALSHSTQFKWEDEALIVGVLGYKRWTLDDRTWLRERSKKTELWLHAWQRLEKETDTTFDVNDRKNQPAMRVYPPLETGMPAGTPPAAIKDVRLRAKYETAIADNRRKSEKLGQQMSLRLHGPSFKSRAERWLVQAYSQAPGRSAELNRYLNVYIRDIKTRRRILSEVHKND